MASLQPNSKTTDALAESTQLTEAMMCIRLMDANQPSGVSGKNYDPLEISQRTFPENSLIIREALRMDLPRHLVLRSVQKRFQTIGSNYTDLKDLVADLFEQDGLCHSPLDQEVPMETNQLEESMMMNIPVVKKALQMGAPPHLLKPVLRAKILGTGAPHTHVGELLADVNKS